jgi:iron complex outermembrane receptor protein
VPLYPEKFFAGFELLATSSRSTAQGNRLPGRAIANLNLFSREVVKNVELSAGIYNLFDKKYRDPASPDFAQELNPQDGRTFRVKLTYKF